MQLNPEFKTSNPLSKKGKTKEQQRTAMSLNPTRKRIYRQTIKTVKTEERIRDDIRSKRDVLNMKVKTYFEEAAEFRKERDKINLQVKALKNERTELQVQLKSRKENTTAENINKSQQNKAKRIHEKLKKLASQSQEMHNQMLEKIKEARKIRKEADDTHKLVKDQTSVIKKYRSQIKLMQQEAMMEYLDIFEIKKSKDRSEFVKMIQITHFASIFG